VLVERNFTAVNDWPEKSDQSSGGIGSSSLFLVSVRWTREGGILETESGPQH